VDEQAMQCRDRAQPLGTGGGKSVAGPRQARLTELSEILNNASSVQRLTTMAAPPGAPTPPIQRTVDDAIVFAAHNDINLDWPPSEANIVKMLRHLSADPASHAFAGLKQALLQGQSPENSDRLEALIAGAAHEAEMGSGDDLAEMDESEGGSSAEDADADLERHTQARTVVTDTMKSLLPQLIRLIGLIEESDRAQPALPDPYLPGLRQALAFIQAEAGNDDDGGRITVEPASARGSFAETNIRNKMVTFYQSFFGLGLSERENVVLHETIHAVLGVTDVAYHWQRIFAHLPIAKALTNPDNYVARFRGSVPGDAPLRQAAAITSEDPTVDVGAVEREVGQAEAIVLWGKTEFVKIAAQFAPGQPGAGPLAAAFRKSYPTEAPATLVTWASLIAQACDHATGLLARKMDIVETTTDAGGDAFAQAGDVLQLKYRKNYPDMPFWFCAKIFQQYTAANTSLAKALVAVYRASGQAVL
jgi:hypothetical protein